jgi:LysM repeat protein
MSKLSMWQLISGLGRKFVLFLCALGLGLVLAAAANAAPPDNEGEPATQSEGTSPETATAQPRATFPYTIRSGDTLGSIADEFGVDVAQLARLNRISEDTELMAGDTLKIPNPFLARERELNAEVDKLTLDKREAEEKTEKVQSALESTRAQLDELTTSNQQYVHNLRVLPWWRTAAVATAVAAILMFGVMLAALIEWWILRGRFRAVAELNDSLRRLDFKYKSALAKAELRLQELYGRRRRGLQDGQERAQMPEELEIERLTHELKEILEHHLARLGPPSAISMRARGRELIGTVGSPVEARGARR